MIVFSILFLIGLCLESLAVFVLIKDFSSIVIIILLHSFASFFIVYAIHQFRSAFVSYNKAVVSMFFMFVFFIPILGIITSFILARWLCTAQGKRVPQNIKALPIRTPFKPLRTRYGVSGLKIRLQSSESSLDTRINALKVLTTLPPDKSNLLIRTILLDKQDELRLLAFNLIDAQENRVVAEINKALALLDNAISEEQKVKVYSYLGRQYWELVYCNLIEPAMLDFVLAQALHYFEKAKSQLSQDSTYWYILGRIYLRLKKYESAIAAFDQSLLFGETKYRVTPYLAEAYFYQKKYHLTKQLLSTSQYLIGAHLNYSNIEFWSNKHV